MRSNNNHMYKYFMKKSNLILTLFISSLFISTSLDAAVFDLNILKNNQKRDLLIASPGGHGGRGNKPKDKKEECIKRSKRAIGFFERQLFDEERLGKSTEKTEKKIKEYKQLLSKCVDTKTPAKKEEIIGGDPNSLAPEIKETQDNKTDKKLLKEIVDDRRKFIEAERKDPGLTYFEIAKDKVSNLIKKTAASNPSPSDDFFEFTDKKYARLKELELIKNFIDIVVYESVHSGKDFADYSLGSNKKLPRKLQLRKQIFEKQHSLVSKINRKQYSEEIRVLWYKLVEGGKFIKEFKMRGLWATF